MYFNKLLFLGILCVPSFAVLYTQPQQIHLSYGADPTQMIVTWVTIDETPTPIVEYGITGLEEQAFGSSDQFIDGGSENRRMFIHRVVVRNLNPGQKYMYHCGSYDGWSSLFTFTAMRDGNDWSPRFAVYGDLGNINGQSIPRLQEDIQKGLYHAILHVGDFAYDFDTDNARTGDEFMRQIEPIAAYVPYMTCPGNHEEKYGSGEMNNHFYSYNIGPAHIVSFSTEFYYYTQYGWDQIGRQFKWLENDLMEANEPQNRDQRPWIIVMGHKPLYCCSSLDLQCDDYERKILRQGIKIKNEGPVLYGLEDLFYKYGVDLEFYAHEHNYQRLFPVYNNKVFNGTKANPYVNPKAPIHIVTGSAGCQERHSNFDKNLPEWSALRNEDYGFTRMTIHNKTHLVLQQVSDDQGGKIVDSVTIVKEIHGPQAWL